VTLACQRHLDDLARAADGGWAYYWEPEYALSALDYFASLRHSKGEWAGQPFRLEPWQVFIIGSLMGWRRRSDHRRRFRVAYVEVPRKNGKSTLAAGLGTMLAFDDDEPGAEVYAAATKLDQAKIVWLEAKRMILRTPHLRQRVVPLMRNLHDPQSASKFEPLGADTNTLDGLNVHAAVVDEFMMHPNRGLWDVLDTATGARRQPLLFAITTAGSNRAGPCYERRMALIKMLEHTAPCDETVFGVIFTIDEADDWTKPEVWAKANPGLGVNVSEEDLARACKDAQAMPSAQVAFLTKRLNVWVHADQAWLLPELWHKCRRDEWPNAAALEAAERWIGLDLAGGKNDVAARVDLIRYADEWWIEPHFYLAEELLSVATRAETAHYEGWHRSGYLTLTGLNIYEAIEADLLADARRLSVRWIGYDPWQADDLAKRMQGQGAPMVEIRPNVGNFSEPMKEIEALVRAGQIHHQGNAMMDWMMGNVVCQRDAKDNIYPRKTHPSFKIDGPVALLIAHRCTRLDPPDAGPSRLNSPDEEVLVV
jgi:phage terminase large subunit-like protein